MKRKLGNIEGIGGTLALTRYREFLATSPKLLSEMETGRAKPLPWDGKSKQLGRDRVTDVRSPGTNEPVVKECR